MPLEGVFTNHLEPQKKVGAWCRPIKLSAAIWPYSARMSPLMGLRRCQAVIAASAAAMPGKCQVARQIGDVRNISEIKPCNPPIITYSSPHIRSSQRDIMRELIFLPIIKLEHREGRMKMNTISGEQAA